MHHTYKTEMSKPHKTALVNSRTHGSHQYDKEQILPLSFLFSMGATGQVIFSTWISF
jgi:hypothetical protein